MREGRTPEELTTCAESELFIPVDTGCRFAGNRYRLYGENFVSQGMIADVAFITWIKQIPRTSC